MNDHGKSDSRVVPAKLANKTGQPVAEPVEERRLAEGNTGQQNAPRTQGRDDGASSALERVRRVARKDKEARFTALLHHVDLARLWAAYAAISPKAAPGVDRVTWDAYGQDLRANLEDLLRRVHSGAYRASPSRRVYIPKPDGRLRPLGIATVTSYCTSLPWCLGIVRFSCCCLPSQIMPGGADIWVASVALVCLAAGLRCPDAAIRARHSASVAGFQGMQSLFPAPRRASSCPVSIQ
jgi:hypothetical protein